MPTKLGDEARREPLISSNAVSRELDSVADPSDASRLIVSVVLLRRLGGFMGIISDSGLGETVTLPAARGADQNRKSDAGFARPAQK